MDLDYINLYNSMIFSLKTHLNTNIPRKVDIFYFIYINNIIYNLVGI